MLALHQQDRPAAGRLQVGQLGKQLAEVQAYPLEERLVRLAQHHVGHLDEPTGQPAGIVVTADIWPGAEQDPHARCGAQLNESTNITVVVKGEPPLARLMK